MMEGIILLFTDEGTARGHVHNLREFGYEATYGGFVNQSFVVDVDISGEDDIENLFAVIVQAIV